MGLPDSAPYEANGSSWSKGFQGAPVPPAAGAAVLLGSLTLNLLALGLPVVILQVYDRILPNQAVETFTILILGLAAIMLLDGLIRIGRSHLNGRAAASYEHSANCRAVDRLLSTDICSFEKDPPGVHLDRLQAIGTLREFHAGQAKLLLIDLPFVLLFVGLIWMIAGSLVLVLLTLLVFLAVGAFAVGKMLQTALKDRAKLDERRHSFIIEVIGGMLTVKALAMEPQLLRRYERLQESGATTTYRVTYLSNLGQSVGALFSNLTMVAVATAGATQIIAGELTIGGLAACTLLAGRTVQPLLRALGLWTQFQSIALAEDKLRDLFRFEPEERRDLPEIGQLEGSLELKGLSFAYDEAGPKLLEQINLRVEPGEVIGISGDTGSGKSSLLLLITGALQPVSGQVLFDGKDIARFEPQSLRRQIAFMPQTINLFQGTLLENLTMFSGNDAEDRALDAVRLLGLDKLIHRLPMGYATQVGDGSQNDLPGGLACGIVMARALLWEPKVLLFDEANSALDAKSDASLKEAMARIKGGPTMILISHRPSFLALADRTFELVDGALVERKAARPDKAADVPGRALQGRETDSPDSAMQPDGSSKAEGPPPWTVTEPRLEEAAAP